MILFILGAAAGSIAWSDDGPVKIDLTIENHSWKPAEVHVPSGKRVVLDVKNLDATAEEFDSTDLKIEKVIPGNGEGTVRLRALDAGRYSFTGEYHPETAKGVVVAE